MELKVYKEHEGGVLEDISKFYQESLYNDILQKVYITWNLFLKITGPGKYVIIAPKRTGLFSKYDTKWKVIVTSNTMMATLKKIYYEEQEGENNE
jgi:hypothetical protein